jgi:hypothetical protein
VGINTIYTSININDLANSNLANVLRTPQRAFLGIKENCQNGEENSENVLGDVVVR